MIPLQLQEQINYWKQSAQKNFAAAQTLFEGKHYDGSLFFCHLSLEKYLKGLVVEKTKKAAPYIHDLTKLAELAGLDLSDEQTKILRIITTFNIAGRYPEIKCDFYKRCTKEYTSEYLQITKKLLAWLKKQHLKK